MHMQQICYEFRAEDTTDLVLSVFERDHFAMKPKQ